MYKSEKKISPSAEDYLEAIYMLDKGDGVRITDISIQLDVKKPSANKAIGLLREEGYLTQEKYGNVFLTEEGLILASKVLSKHKVLFDFLHKRLGVEKHVAEKEACEIEHLLSDETVEKIKGLI